MSFVKIIPTRLRACLNLECKIVYGYFLSETRSIFEGIAGYQKEI